VASTDATKKSQSKSKETRSSELPADMQALKIEQKVERKNLKVLEEFKKSGLKRSVSFVVVGKLMFDCRGHADVNRTCRPREEHINGSASC
jgi:hypothetical protein